MACLPSCVSISTLQQVQQPSPRPCSSLAQSWHSSSSPCLFFQMSIGFRKLTPLNVFRRRARIRRLHAFPSTAERLGLLGIEAAEQEAATSTLWLQEVAFTWRGKGSEVFVSGDFWRWEKKIPLVKGTDGVFLAKQKLPIGEHQYKYVVDGEWLHSPDYPTIPDGVGGFNNQIIVTDSMPSSMDKPASKSSSEEMSPKDAVNGPPASESAESKVVRLADASKPPKVTISTESDKAVGTEINTKAKKQSDPTPRTIPAGKMAAAKPSKKIAEKPLHQLMSDDVIPALKKKLGKEAGVSNFEILFNDNQLEGSFSKNGVTYSFWAYFPDGKLEGSRGFSLSSHGAPPSTVEPFLIDEKKISAELIVFWITKRLFAQKLLAIN